MMTPAMADAAMNASASVEPRRRGDDYYRVRVRPCVRRSRPARRVGDHSPASSAFDIAGRNRFLVDELATQASPGSCLPLTISAAIAKSDSRRLAHDPMNASGASAHRSSTRRTRA